VGSDTNYQIETAVTLCLAAAIGLEASGFHRAFARGAQSPVTLLVLAVALHAVLNFRVTAQQVIERTSRVTQLAAQREAIEPLLPRGMPVVSADTNLLLQTRRPLLVEPLIYTLLVEAGRIDGGILLSDLRQGRIARVVLYEDLSRPASVDPELPRLPAAHTAVLRDTYRLVRHIPGPYKNGLYLYQPAGSIR
jgi:hypothetical protein